VVLCDQRFQVPDPSQFLAGNVDGLLTTGCPRTAESVISRTIPAYDFEMLRFLPGLVFVVVSVAIAWSIAESH
jgi:uncharacterized protein YjeT (DUF2065 family)